MAPAGDEGAAWLEFERTQLVPRIAYRFGSFMQSVQVGGIGVPARSLLYGMVSDAVADAVSDPVLATSLVSLSETDAVACDDFGAVVSGCAEARAERIFDEMLDVLGID